MNPKINCKIVNGKIIIIVAAIFVISCTNLEPKELLEPEEVMSKEKLLTTQSAEKTTIKQVIDKSESLTLSQVLACIRKYNPTLQATKARILETQGKSQQKMLYPNPTLEFESEDMPVDNFGDFGRAENSFILRQKFIMPWKRNATQATLNKQIDIAKQDYVILKNRVLTEGKRTFFQLLATQEKLTTTRRLLEIVQTSLDVSKKLVKTGEARNVESIRAQVEYSQAILKMQELEGKVDNTYQKLFLLMGTPNLKIKKLQGVLLTQIPEFDMKEYNLKDHPELKKNELGYDLSQLKLQQAEEERWPDVQVGFGVGNNNNEDEEFFRFSLQIPLPIFNRNQGGISEAKGSKQRAESETQATRNEIKININQYLRLYLVAKKQVDRYKKDIIPEANQAFELTKKLYQSSEVGQIELLNAQQTLIKTELGYTDSLAKLWNAVIYLEYFTGSRLLPKSIDRQ
ncbi:TolC family protein [Candidatus Uabimicrobium sp. HlEnr_7]|uniref:TolC family protein n=1 Tax=Candidatus Uabimicrobium helgolandensis TaxID=3095367 RepID=UPI0035575968